MAHRLLSKDEQEARDLRIVRLADMGVLYADIARATGISAGTIGTILKRRRHEGKTSSRVGSGRANSFNRLDAVDGVDG
jgi:transposase